MKNLNTDNNAANEDSEVTSHPQTQNSSYIPNAQEMLSPRESLGLDYSSLSDIHNTQEDNFTQQTKPTGSNLPDLCAMSNKPTAKKVFFFDLPNTQYMPESSQSTIKNIMLSQDTDTQEVDYLGNPTS